MDLKTGLVLEGGGVRGIYTAGVLDVFMEHGLSFDGVIGVSAGAIHGCSYLSGQKGRSIRYYRKYCSDPRFMSVQSWLKTGDVVGADFCYHELPEKLDIYDHEAFARCAVPFYVTVSNVETGKPEYLRVTDMRAQIDYLRASASLPYFSRLVEIDGKKYLDGGCTDAIPLKAFESMGYGRNVVILTRHRGYRKKPEFQGLNRLLYGKYPAFVRALEQRHTNYNNCVSMLRQKERAGQIFTITPSQPLDIGRLEKDPEKVQAIYDIGRKDALNAVESLKAWLGKTEEKE